MTITVTALVNAPNGGTGTETLASSSFTPSANSRVVVFVFGQAGDTDSSGTRDPLISTTITGWDTSLARVDFVNDLAIGFNPFFAVFEGVMGASPSSGTITIDAKTGTGNPAYMTFVVVGLTGTVAIPTRKQTAAAKLEDDGGGNSETHTTSSLAAAATNGNTCLVSFGAAIDGVSTPATPASWTSVDSTSANFSAIAVFKRTDFTGTSETCSDLGTLVADSGSVLIEYEEVSTETASQTRVWTPPPGRLAPFGDWQPWLGSPAGSSGTTFTSSLDGTVSSSAAIVKDVTAAKTATVTPAGALAKAVTKPGLAGTITSAGALVKLVSKLLAGTVSSSGVLTAVKVVLRTFTATITPAGALVKADAKPLAGTVTSVGVVAKADSKAVTGTVTSAAAIVKAVSKALAGTVASSGTVATVRVLLRTFTGTIAAAGAVVKQAQKTATGSATSSGSIVRAVSKTITGTIAPAGFVAKFAARILAGVVSAAGAVATALLGAGEPDNNPIRLTIRPRGTTATASLVDNTATSIGGNTATATVAGNKATSRARTTATAREQQ